MKNGLFVISFISPITQISDKMHLNLVSEYDMLLEHDNKRVLIVVLGAAYL